MDLFDKIARVIVKRDLASFELQHLSITAWSFAVGRNLKDIGRKSSWELGSGWLRLQRRSFLGVSEFEVSGKRTRTNDRGEIRAFFVKAGASIKKRDQRKKRY